MYRRQEICRNFQRGNCQYGARCKFLHTVPQQTVPNPYGFGVKASPQTKGQVGFGTKNQSQKTFENKWNRFSPLNSANTTPSRQSESQPQVVTHTCTDPETCKYQIVEDYKNEQPLWKLTCYGHWKYLPCDIVGDISYEELRAAAYDDACKGLPVQFIVERERNLLKNKIAEFDNFLQKPYVILQSHGPDTPVFSGTAPNASLSGFQNNLPHPFGQIEPPTYSGNLFLQPNPFNVSAQTSSGFNMSSAAGPFVTQSPTQPFGSPSTFAASSPFPLVSSASPFPSNGLNPSHKGYPSSEQTTPNVLSSGSQGMTGVAKDMSIWLKEDWEVGEVPEEEPPPSVIQRGLSC